MTLTLPAGNGKSNHYQKIDDRKRITTRNRINTTRPSTRISCCNKFTCCATTGSKCATVTSPNENKNPRHNGGGSNLKATTWSYEARRLASAGPGGAGATRSNETKRLNTATSAAASSHAPRASAAAKVVASSSSLKCSKVPSRSCSVPPVRHAERAAFAIGNAPAEGSQSRDGPAC